MEKLIQIEQVLQIGAKLLQIGAAPVVTNWGNSYYKLGQFQLLQIVPKLLQIWAELLQIGAGITNWDNYYKSVQNRCIFYNFIHLFY